MALIDRLAERAAELSAGAVALAFGDASNLVQGLATVAGVAMLGKRLRDGAASRTCRDGAARALTALQGARAFDPPTLDRAAAILSELPATARITPADIVVHARAADPARALAADLAARMAGPDDPEVRQILALVLEAGVATCLEDDDFRAALTPALMMQMARDLGLVAEGIDRIDRRLDALAQLLAEQGLTGGGRADLERLAGLFGIDAAGMSSDDLAAALTLKAQDHMALKATFAALDDRMADLARHKRAVEDALRRLDLRQADALLHHIDHVETDIAAETRMLRVRVCLLHGDFPAAHDLLRRVRDMAVSLSSDNYAQVTYRGVKLLLDWGNRHGALGALHAAGELAQELIDATDGTQDDAARSYRILAAMALTDVFCKAVQQRYLDRPGDSAMNLLRLLDHMRDTDTTAGDAAWGILVNAKANVLRVLVNVGLVENGPEVLADVDAMLREVLAAFPDHGDAGVAMTATHLLAAVILGRADAEADATRRMDLLQEASTLLEEGVLDPARGAEDDMVQDALIMMGVVQMRIAEEAQGPMRDMMLAAVVRHFDDLARRHAEREDTGALAYVAMNLASLAVTRTEGAAGAAQARLRADALNRIEAAMAVIDSHSDTRMAAHLEGLRRRLDAACPAPEV